MLLPAARARAYLVHDHESEFYATSVESRLGRGDLRPRMHAICASAVAGRHRPRALRRAPSRCSTSASTTTSTARRPVPRRRDTVVFYARDVTPRRAVPLGAAGVAGAPGAPAGPADRAASATSGPIDAPFDYEHLGIATPARARVGLQRGHRRPRPLDDQLLADPAGDARVRDAVRRPRRASAPRASSAPTARCAAPLRPCGARRRRSSACSTTRRSGDGARAPAWPSWRDRRGTSRRRQVEAGLREAVRLTQSSR